MALALFDCRWAPWGRTLRTLALAAALTVLAGCGDDEEEAQADSPGAPTAPVINGAPSISGAAPAQIRVGQAYSFQPTASDPDGDRLTFTATNLPRWASFTPGTGKISGTPAAGEEGVYDRITISVSDGRSTASLGAFRVTVTQDTASGTALLSWTSPTTNADGSVLTDLSGFRIIYGRNANDLDQSIAITNPSISTYVIERLSAGTWHFAVIALNARSVESPPSNLGSKTIS